MRLCISDSGSGIEPAALARIGEPFFTTKTTGTGLGLAVVTAVARAHQGRVDFRSRPGRGTCAIVSLPLIPGAGNPACNASEAGPLAISSGDRS